MPVISIEIGELSKEQKQELIKQLSSTAAKITNIPLESFTVTIKELADENIGIGGKDIGRIKEEYR